MWPLVRLVWLVVRFMIWLFEWLGGLIVGVASGKIGGAVIIKIDG